MWSVFGLLGLLGLVLLGGAWLAIRLMEEQERIDHILATLPPKKEEPETEIDWDRESWWLADLDDEPKWSGQ